MKKLMIAAAAAMFGIAANAAAVTWNAVISEFDGGYSPAIGNIVLATGTDLWTLTFNAEGTATDTITGDTTGIFASGTEWSATLTSLLANDDYTPGSTMYAKTITFTMPSLTGDPTTDGGALELLNASIGAAFQNEMGTLPFAQEAVAAGWSAAPEPTSGLLLLIGVAGLALKRKRA